MALRWTAAGMMEAAKGFRRLKAYRLHPILRAALVAHATEHVVATKEIDQSQRRLPAPIQQKVGHPRETSSVYRGLVTSEKSVSFEFFYDAPLTESFLSAFAKLEAHDPDAIAAFAAQVGKLPKDQLASFHLKRLLNGATGTVIAMSSAAG